MYVGKAPSDWDEIMNLDIELVKDPFYTGDTGLDPIYTEYQETKDPPILHLPPIKVPLEVDQPNGGIDDLPIIKTSTVTYWGNVIDSGAAADPLPYATVEFYASGGLIQRVATNAAGEFEVNLPIPADTIKISSAEHKPWAWPASIYQHKFELERKSGDMEEVIIPVKSGNSQGLWILAILAAVAISQSK